MTLHLARQQIKLIKNINVSSHVYQIQRTQIYRNPLKIQSTCKKMEFPKKRLGNIFGLEKIGSPMKTSKLCQNPSNCEILNYYLIWIKRSFLKFKSLTDVGYEVEHHEVGIQDSCSSRRGRGTSINFKPMYILKTDLKK